jgi:hypothetical protein
LVQLAFLGTWIFAQAVVEPWQAWLASGMMGGPALLAANRVLLHVCWFGPCHILSILMSEMWMASFASELARQQHHHRVHVTHTHLTQRSTMEVATDSIYQTLLIVGLHGCNLVLGAIPWVGTWIVFVVTSCVHGFHSYAYVWDMKSRNVLDRCGEFETHWYVVLLLLPQLWHTLISWHTLILWHGVQVFFPGIWNDQCGSDDMPDCKYNCQHVVVLHDVSSGEWDVTCMHACMHSCVR